MLTLLIKKFKKALTVLIMACLITTSLFTTTTHAKGQDYIRYSIMDEARDYIEYTIKETSNFDYQSRKCEVVIRVGEHEGKAGKRIYLTQQQLRSMYIPKDVPIRQDSKGYYISEWDINLKEAKALVNELRKKGVDAQLQVAKTKSEDLNAAGRISNKSNPYLYISLHHNYYNESSKGYFAMYNPNDAKGAMVANRLSNSIKNNYQVPQRNNQVNTGYIGELNTINSTTTPVLLELGFFSNLKELQVICSDSYVKYVSSHMSDEIVKILNEQYR